MDYAEGSILLQGKWRPILVWSTFASLLLSGRERAKVLWMLKSLLLRCQYYIRPQLTRHQHHALSVGGSSGSPLSSEATAMNL